MNPLVSWLLAACLLLSSYSTVTAQRGKTRSKERQTSQKRMVILPQQ